MAQEETRKKKPVWLGVWNWHHNIRALFYLRHSCRSSRSVLFPTVSFYLFYNAGTNRSFSRYGERKYERCSPIWLDGSRGDCRKCNPLFLRVDVFPSGGFRNAL